jgi:hypothetical protein
MFSMAAAQPSSLLPFHNYPLPIAPP